MNELLALAVKAHGGLERWNKVKSLKVAASITGAIWFVKSKGDALKKVIMTVDTKAERLITDFLGRDKRSIFEPTRVVIGEALTGRSSSPATTPRSPSKASSGRRPGMTSMLPISVVRLCGPTSTLRSSTRG